ncbi:hypothetical protein AMELA_G00289020 [Ameiurus melas]|uniref:Immunoglobulin C1-set domain-containing protein n=1 Tax=Ameiurus melas TaxID=219545 RepID=A0A7J5ZL03_AMEME|nr:hypothetical protein AMELA_G00289020 [Ameiurus melas]
MTLLKDGQGMPEHLFTVDDLLPNADGTYQMRKTVEISEEELQQKHNYICTATHLSRENKMDVYWVYQRCSPDILDSTLPSFQEPAASYSPSGYYPDYSVGYAHLIDQDPFWNAADVPESRTSDPEKEEEELDAMLNLVSEMQVR